MYLCLSFFKSSLNSEKAERWRSPASMELKALRLSKGASEIEVRLILLLCCPYCCDMFNTLKVSLIQLAKVPVIL